MNDCSHRSPTRLLATLAAATLAFTASSAPAHAQSDTPFRIQAGTPATDRFKVDSSGGFVAFGYAKEVGTTTGCASLIPATGEGTRFMWFPCRGALRFGRVPAGQTNWDDTNMQDFTFAGGNQVVAKGYGAFAFGDVVNVTSVVGVGFGSDVTVSGTAGFSAGASNKCTGFACTAIGYTTSSGGEGSVALGYRTTANNNYSVAIGYRATNNGHTGTMVLGDQSTTDSVRNQSDNEFRARYAGGFVFRTSPAANGVPGVSSNTGCDLPAGSGIFTCSSSRDIKHGFQPIDGENVLDRLASMPLMTWVFNEEPGEVRHLGPVAEDFHTAFELGNSDKSVGVSDLAGVALASAKALEVRTRELQDAQDELAQKQAVLTDQTRRIESLETELTALRAERALSDTQLRERIDALERALARLPATNY